MNKEHQELRKSGKGETHFPFVLPVSSSRLRAFAPSCKKPKARQGQPALRFSPSFLSLWAKGTKGGFVPGVLSAAKLWSDPLAQLSGQAFLFSHEGMKARRREGKRFEELEGGVVSPLLPLFAAGESLETEILSAYLQ